MQHPAIRHQDFDWLETWLLITTNISTLAGINAVVNRNSISIGHDSGAEPIQHRPLSIRGAAVNLAMFSIHSVATCTQAERSIAAFARGVKLTGRGGAFGVAHHRKRLRQSAALGRRRHICAVPNRRRRRDYEERYFRQRPVYETMGNLRRHFRPLSRAESHGVAFKFQGCDTRKDIEELPGSTVEVPRLAGSSRNALLDHAERRVLKQVPPVTTVSPMVVFSGFN